MLCANYWVSFYAGDDLSSHHVRIVEACQLYAPALGLVPDEHSHPPLCTARRRHDQRRAHHVVYQPVASISLGGGIGIRQNHKVEAANMYLLDGLRKP